MKLVEILARDWAEWPQALVSAFQEKNGAIWGNMWFDYKDALGIVNIADDWETALITRGQWQAERNRIKTMGTFDKKALHDELRSRQGKRMPMPDCVEPEEPTYEQQLWDRVAENAINKAIGEVPGLHDVVQVACNIADDFMAERAKRVGK